MQLPRMVKSDWWEEALKTKVVWRSTTMVLGALCVMTVGASTMPMWCVDSLVTVKLHLHEPTLFLVKAVVQSTMTMWPALGVRPAWPTAPIVALDYTTVVTMKMQEWCVPLPQVG